MAGPNTWRKRVVVAAIVALTPLTAIACGRQQANTPNNAGDSQLGSATTAPPPPPAPSYPSTAKAYAQALLTAWMHKDYTRLDQLAVTSAVQQIKDSITYGGLPNSNWHFINCQGAAGSSYCTFRNDNGDETVIRLANSQIGHPTAVTEAPLDRTEFPSDASAYVNDFIDAWRNGNRQRMLAYSSQTVIDFVTHYTPLSADSICMAGGAAGSTYVTVKGLGDSAGAYYTFRVTDEVLSSPNRKHAISSAQLADPSLC